MSTRPKPIFSFHVSSNTNPPSSKPPPHQSKLPSQPTRSLADLNADELFDRFDDLFEVKIRENFNPDTYRIDTARTVIKDLTKKFNDMGGPEPTLKRQSPSEALIPKKPQIPLGKKGVNERFMPEKSFMKTQNLNESRLNDSKSFHGGNYLNNVSTNNIGSYFTKRVEESSFELKNRNFPQKNEEYSFESKNRSFYLKSTNNASTNPPGKAKVIPKNAAYLVSIENKENVPTNSNMHSQKQFMLDSKTSTNTLISKPYLHRRVETYCDMLHSIDDERPFVKPSRDQASPFTLSKEEPQKLMNKSLVDCRQLLNKKPNDSSSYENVGRLLKLLKQDAEKRINSRRKAEMSFTMTSSFLKPVANYGGKAMKEKNNKRSISTGVNRK